MQVIHAVKNSKIRLVCLKPCCYFQTLCPFTLFYGSYSKRYELVITCKKITKKNG